MSNRYKVRIYESGDSDGCIAAGRIVRPIDRCFTVHAASAEEVEHKIRKDIQDGKLQTGRVYQICPSVGNPELIRSIALCTNGSQQRVFLDMAKGLYSEFRRIRYIEVPKAQVVEEVMEPEAVPA